MVADAIVRVSAGWDADIIVLGWHGQTTLKRYLFGGVAAR
jgi:nucleotide-binding universal stress UspA family protein